MHLLGVIVASIVSLLNVTQLAAASAVFFDAHTAEPQATILFAGDMMLDRSIRTVVEKKGGHFIFFCVDATLADADMVVANLEGPITDKKSVSVGSKPGEARNFVFTFPKSTAKLLKDHHIDLVNLGNNHILNFGYDGARSTMAALDAADIAHFGDPVNFSVATTSINGIPLAFISYNEFLPAWAGGGKAPTTRQQIAAGRVRALGPRIRADCTRIHPHACALFRRCGGYRGHWIASACRRRHGDLQGSADLLFTREFHIRSVFP